MFLQSGSSKLNNHLIHPDWRLSSDYATLTIFIFIVEKNINTSKFSIVKNSKEEDSFIKNISFIIRNLDISDLSVIDKLENIVNTLASNIECA